MKNGERIFFITLSGLCKQDRISRNHKGKENDRFNNIRMKNYYVNKTQIQRIRTFTTNVTKCYYNKCDKVLIPIDKKN
jgi:hypothetical protein